ncbi:MAG: energy-coupling factor transporter transmembrane protein EcfT [Deltaproteobacteria bacterium]|nr:energy-coupling factor transporter transmembrane protein EcfT [Deltaproteobacteria bacterium]
MYHTGMYVEGESVAHRLDPRVKIVSVIGISFLILSGSLFALAALSGFLLWMYRAAGLPFRRLYGSLRPATGFLVLLFVLHLAFTEGRPLPPFPPWRVTVTYEGLHGGTLVTWRFALLLAWASVLTMTTSSIEMVGGVEALLRPLPFMRTRSQDLALMISMAMRFVPTMREEMDRVKMAQLSRGASYGTGPLLQRAKAVTSLMWPVILGTLRRADNLATAMEARGYRGGPCTSMREFRLSRADYGAIAVIASIAALQWL